MVLFTLPEKLNETIFFEKDDPFSPFQTCDFLWTSGVFLRHEDNNQERSLDNLKKFDPLNQMPDITDLLPSKIVPFNIMADK